AVPRRRLRPRGVPVPLTASGLAVTSRRRRGRRRAAADARSAGERGQDVVGEQRRDVVGVAVTELLPADLLDLRRGAADRGARGPAAAAAGTGPACASRASPSSTPSSSRVSRTAVWAGVSPGSGLPPGNMNRAVPRLRTVSTRPAPSRSTTALTRMTAVLTVPG